MLRRRLALATFWIVLVALGSPALAQTSPTPPGVQPFWRIVMFVLLGIVVLALLFWAFAALNRRRGEGETPVEGNADEDATPGPSRSEDGGLGTQR